MKNKEGKTLQEVLKENQMIIGIIVVGALLVGLFYLGYSLQNNALEQCSQNNDRDYCLVNL